MKIFRLIYFCFFFLLLESTGNAQILNSKENILKTMGLPDETGIDNNGYQNFIYNDSIQLGDKKFERNMVLYFIPYEDKDICTHVRMIYPISELQNNLEYFNSNFKRIDEKNWLDMETGYSYRMDNTYPFCSFLIWKDK